MRFDLTDLRLFANILDTGSITAGAQASHMTLASASERVRGMEDDLGTPLLVRGRRGVSATPAGHTLQHHARRVLAQMAQLHGELGEYGAGLRGHVRMLCNTSALSEHLPPVLSRFLAQHPGIAVDLAERASSEIVDALRHGMCDIGVVSDAVDTHGLTCQHFRPDPLVLIVPPQHALAARRSVALADVLGEPFIGLGAHSALHGHLAQHARQLGARIDYRLRLHNLGSICDVVGRGTGVAVVPLAAARRHARATGIRRVALTDRWAQRALQVCVAAGADLPVHVQQMVAHLARESQGSAEAE